MTKELYTIPLTIISFVINITLIFRTVYVPDDFNAINYFFFIFMSISLSVLVFRFICLVSNFKLVVGFSLVVGVGIFLYTNSFFLLNKIYLGFEFAFIIASQRPEIAARRNNLQQVQNPAKLDIENDILNGISNKDICIKYNKKPYQVTRLKQKLENESKGRID